VQVLNLMKENLKKPWVCLGIALALPLLILFLYHYLRYQSTDNAYINAHTTALATLVPGKIIRVLVNDHQAVVKDQLLFEVDPEPFKVALNKANALLEIAKQTVGAEEAAVEVAQAQVNARQADLDKVTLNVPRVEQLVGKKFLSASEEDNIVATLKTAVASLDEAKAQLKQAEKKYGKPGLGNATIQEALANVQEAELNLRYTQVLSPADGFISELHAEVGKVVQPGESLCAFVDSRSFWVDANFKETELTDIKIGQRAEISVDMYPDIIFKGYVESISPNTGTVFSLLPPQNASGNWVKVTQRVAAKILIDNPKTGAPLKIGTSATVTIDLHSTTL